MTTSISTWEVSAGVGSSTNANKASGADLGREDFLNLLITQLQNQDPLNPMESADFTAQLAQFSSLEQLFNANDNLEAIQTAISGQNSGDVVSYIGKVIVAEDDSMTVKGGLVSTGNFTIEETASVEVTIFDSYGMEVKTINLGEMEAGTYSVSWDGYDNDGISAEDGTYSYEVSATNSAGGAVNAHTLVSGEVTGLTYEYGRPHLIVGERMVPAADVLEVHEASAAESEETG